MARGYTIDMFLEAGGATKYDAPAVLQLLRGRLVGVYSRPRAHTFDIDVRVEGEPTR